MKTYAPSPFTGEFTIETASGGGFNLGNPQVVDVKHVDIALHLSRLCRFVGACRFYSVAEHSVLVARLARWLVVNQDRIPDLVRDPDQPYKRTVPPVEHHLACYEYGLLHDASEAYTGDLSAPLKQTLRLHAAEVWNGGGGDSPFDRVEAEVQSAIMRSYNRPWWLQGDYPERSLIWQTVKLADMWAFVIEATNLMPSKAEGYNIPEHVGALGGKPMDVDWSAGLPPDKAARAWLRAWSWSGR